MRLVLACVLLIAGASTASAQFLGGYAEGAARAQELSIQERALRLDALDGGSRYQQLRQQHQLDRMERQLRINGDFLEQAARPRDRMLYGR